MKTFDPNAYDLVGQMIAWEEGELDHDEEVVLFQKLVDDGTVWSLQGTYGRHAMWLISTGEVHRG